MKALLFNYRLIIIFIEFIIVNCAEEPIEMLVVGLDEVLPKSAADEEGLTLVRYEPCLAPTFLFLHFVEAFLKAQATGRQDGLRLVAQLR